MSDACFHCGEPLPRSGVRRAELDGAERAFCCTGCVLAAELIRDAGLVRYYAVAEAGARPSGPAVDLSIFDSEVAIAPYIHRDGERAEITLVLEGLRCAACVWLIEQVLARIDGCRAVRANAVTARIAIEWDSARVSLSALLAPLVTLGYRPHLPSRDDAQAVRRERRDALKRLAVAGLGMMQAMMFAEALYFGGMDPSTRDFFRWIGWLCATPVVLYSGAPFLRGAWRELRGRRPGMDFLVASTVWIAYLASLVETLRGGPVVYYDAAVMFVFVLLATRTLEGAVRRQTRDQLDVLARTQPDVAFRVECDAGGERIVEVSPQALRAGDRIRIRNGDVVPADGVLCSVAAELDEAVLTGESRPVTKRAGDAVLAGSCCRSVPIEVEVSRVGQATTLAHAVRLAERAATERPRLARVADFVASRFVLVLLSITFVVAVAWWIVDPSRVLPVSLAVLAVTCPCALSIAVPATLAAAQSRLAREGVLVARADALERLAAIDTVVFDKTGTLTLGRPVLESIEADDREHALAVAAAIEQSCVHPVADAIRRAAAAQGMAGARATEVDVVAGSGVAAIVDGVRYRLGSPCWIDATLPNDDAILLADPQRVVARFRISDNLRREAPSVIATLAAQNLRTALCSGDAEAPVRRAAAACGIEDATARATPDGKLAAIRARQACGQRVAMVGDGINDTPVLAGADLSIAMGTGAALAQAHADLVLPGARLAAIPAAIAIARRARRIIRQNLAWAVGYNVLALPIAALGYAPPWLAAIGMCASSLTVTLNAVRVLRDAPACAEGTRLDLQAAEAIA